MALITIESLMLAMVSSPLPRAAATHRQHWWRWYRHHSPRAAATHRQHWWHRRWIRYRPEHLLPVYFQQLPHLPHLCCSPPSPLPPPPPLLPPLHHHLSPLLSFAPLTSNSRESCLFYQIQVSPLITRSRFLCFDLSL